MISWVKKSELEDIYQKILCHERLSFDDGMKLYECSNLPLIGCLANFVKKRWHKDQIYFNQNMHINYTNICIKNCKFCFFKKEFNDIDAYVMNLDDMRQKIKTTLNKTISEIHLVGGINTTLNYQYYLDILRVIREINPNVHIKAFTMVELEEIVRVSNKSLENVLQDLKAAGLDSCPGGGCEILSERIHQELFPNKLSPDEWLKTTQIVHAAGLKTNATMLYGHIEKKEERVEHLIKLRSLQDETKGFNAFIPLSFHPNDTHKFGYTKSTAALDLKQIAVGRLMLDNFAHIKAYWVMLSPEIAQIALSFGADDLDGTVIEEKIFHAAGAKTPYGLSKEDLIKIILNSRQQPCERDSIYKLKSG